MSHFTFDESGQCDCADGCMWCCPVKPETREFWVAAQRKSDELGALYAARYPVVVGLAPLIPHDYSLATALFGAETARTLERVDNGCNLYDALYPDGDPEWDEWEAECAARAAHREANAEHYRAEEAKAQLRARQRRIEEKVADESKMRLNREQLKSGLKMEKKQCPCARLYSCVGNKSGGGAKPQTPYVSSECWSHERVTPEFASTWLERHRLDPKKGAEFLPAGMVAKLHADASAAHTKSNPTLLTPRVCPWLHPGEAGWRAEWNANRLFKVAPPPPPAPHRMAAALGASGSALPQSRFASMRAPVVVTRAPWAKASGGRTDGWETPKRR